MKILHVINTLGYGGAERLLSDLLPLQSKTNEVSVVVYKLLDTAFEKKIKEAGIPIISLEEKSYHNPFVIYKLRSIIKCYDVVHAHLFPNIYWVSLAARGLNVKLVYTEHSTSNGRRSKPYMKPIERFMYARFDKIISISDQTQESLLKWLGTKDDRFMIINNGVDIKKLSSVRKKVVPKSLVMVSRFSAPKDQDTVIRAMQHIDIDATLVFVGDGERRAHCEQLVRDLNLTDRVRFLGARSDVADIISSSYIGIQSSHWEGFGLTAVELMACHKPVIATNVDGLRQVVEGAGIIFHQGNELELADIVNRLLNDKEYYNKHADLCLDRACIYDITVMNNKYISVYKGLCNK